MALSLQNFSTMVENMAAAVQGSSKKLLNLTPGSVLRAILEGVASVGLWIEYLILTVLQATRLATSSGADVDSFIADFGLTRLPAVSSTGTVTFSRYTTGQAAFIAVGATVLTLDQTQSFAVVADTTNAAYVASPVAGYSVGSAVSSIDVPVEAVNAGTQGNVLAATIGLISSAIPGIDTVTNANAFTNGQDAETDAEVKVRFRNYLSTLSKATAAAVEYAVQTVASNLTWTVQNNQTANGTYTPGTFTVTIDDGSGATPSATVTTVATAVNAVRPLCSTAVVQAASKLAADLSLTLTLNSGTKTAAEAAVNAALATYLGSLAVGVTLPYSRISQVAYDAYSGISNVSNVTLNGGTADLVPTPSQVVRAGTIAVN